MRKMIIPFLFILLVIGCSIPEKIGLPSWTVPIKLVLLNDTFDADFVAEEIGAFQANGDTLQFYDSVTETQFFSDFDIDDTDIHNTNFALSEFAPSTVEQLNGQPVSIIPNYPNITAPIDIFREFEVFDEFEELKLINGYINVTITNNTIFWLGDIPDGMPLTVQILDGDGELVVEQELDVNIAPLGGVLTRVISLADSTIGNDISMHLLGEGDITENSSAVIDLSATVELDMQITDIVAEYVTNAQVGSLDYELVEGYQEVDLLHPEIVEADSFIINGNSSIIFTFNSPIPMLASFELVSKRGVNQIPLEHFNGDPILLDVEEGFTQIVFNSDEYNINEMLQIIPNGFDYAFDPFTGEETIIPYISFTDSVTVQFELVGDVQITTFEEDGIWVIPLEDGELLIDIRDTEAFETEHFDAYNDGKILIKYWNDTGMELGFDLLVSDDSASVYTEVYNFEEPDTSLVQMFRIPLLEETSGNEFKEFELQVNQEELSYFVSESVYTLSRVHIFSNGESPWTGGLHILAELEVEITVSDGLIEEE